MLKRRQEIQAKENLGSRFLSPVTYRSSPSFCPANIQRPFCLYSTHFFSSVNSKTLATRSKNNFVPHNKKELEIQRKRNSSYFHIGFLTQEFLSNLHFFPCLFIQVKHTSTFLQFLDLYLNAPSDLQPHYGNGVFDNVYLLALDNTKR